MAGGFKFPRSDIHEHGLRTAVGDSKPKPNIKDHSGHYTANGLVPSPSHSVTSERTPRIPFDVWYMIIELVKDPEALWNLRQVCRIFYHHTERLIVTEVLPRTEITIEKCPDKDREFSTFWDYRYVSTSTDQKYMDIEQWAVSGYVDGQWHLAWRDEKAPPSEPGTLLKLRATCDMAHRELLSTKGVMINTGLTGSALWYWNPDWRCDWRMLFGAHFRHGRKGDILIHPIDEEADRLERASLRHGPTLVASVRNGKCGGQVQPGGQAELSRVASSDEPQARSSLTSSTHAGISTEGTVRYTTFSRRIKSIFESFG